ncbi:hypothetical protein LWC35_35240 [Pseudonocardia kujensis]|uniref:hypothetical protein n=1 Tax=Pseudonocardia kujensis TaxID=1128675 RepID=UPI001E6204CB|nr:hypothetical protein [Pseudonocardia kujensis]MCE0768112.1 hypothetical protein [Pseudonocardia kujensis]
MDEEFERLRREPDPVRRGRQATELLATYQQRSVELARLRRAAIEEARDQLGGSYTEVAKAFGLSKGRVTQIRNSAPPAHRAFFGVGPLDVALVGRRILEREDMVIAAEDDAVGAHLLAEVEQLAFTAERLVVDPREEWEPPRDAIVVCGPASAHIGSALLNADPVLGMTIADGARWYIVDKATGERFASPMDDETPRRADVAYLSRHVRDGQVITHIAGIHALGSVGAGHYLTEHLAQLYAAHPEESFSMAVAAEFDGLTPKAIDVIVPPRAWD